MENQSEDLKGSANLEQSANVKTEQSGVEKVAEKDSAPNSLDLEEQTLRIHELRLKVNDLQKSDWKKITTWTGMIAILVAIMGIIGQGILYEIKSAKAEQHLDSVLAKKNIAEDSIKKGYINLKNAKDSIKLIQSFANQEYATYEANILSAKHTLDSIKSLTAAISAKLGQPQTKQINRLIKEAKQTLNTVVESSSINVKKSSISQPDETAKNDTGITKQPLSINDPNDPQKGKWGMLSERNGRKMSAVVTPISNGLYKVIIKVVSTDTNNNPLTGQVIFHLHNTFRNQNPTVEAEGNEAVLTLKVYGSFTVGAETDNGRTKLELDLAQIPNVPQQFKEN